MNEEKQEKQEKKIDDYSKEELIEIIQKIAEIPSLKLDNLNNLDFDKTELKEGIKVGSRLAGIYLTLISAGMDEEQAYQLCVNESTCKNNVDCAIVNGGQQSVTGIGTI